MRLRVLFSAMSIGSFRMGVIFVIYTMRSTPIFGS
jgi:hypothetical protein